MRVLGLKQFSSHLLNKASYHFFICISAICQSGRIKNAVVLTLPLKYIFMGGCSIYSTAYAVYIHFGLIADMYFKYGTLVPMFVMCWQNSIMPKAHTKTDTSRQEKLFGEIQNSFLIIQVSQVKKYSF